MRCQRSGADPLHSGVEQNSVCSTERHSAQEERFPEKSLPKCVAHRGSSYQAVWVWSRQFYEFFKLQGQGGHPDKQRCQARHA